MKLRLSRGLALLLSLAAGLSVLACSSPRVIANYDSATDFSQYRTYGFPKRLGTDDARYSSLLSEMLRKAASRELEARGYEASDEPDLLVNFNIRTEEKLATTQTPTGYYGYRGYGAWGAYDTTVTQYTEGTLNIDLVDRRRNQLVWEGLVIGRVTDSERKKLQQTVDQCVNEIFAKYLFTAGIGEPVEQ